MTISKPSLTYVGQDAILRRLGKPPCQLIEYPETQIRHLNHRSTMLITRKAEFSASHVCARPDWSEEQNRQVYGAAANPHGHGHNYSLEVTLEGEPDPATGMIFDLKALKEIINRQV